MKKLIFFSFLTLSLNTFSKDIIFFGGSKKYILDFDKNSSMILTKNCHKKCMAYTLLSTIKSQELQNGGASIGSLVCIKQLKGSVIVLVDQSHDQNGFCQFSDNSLIDLGSLQALASKLK